MNSVTPHVGDIVHKHIHYFIIFLIFSHSLEVSSFSSPAVLSQLVREPMFS
jgi:hypothetical protein